MLSGLKEFNHDSMHLQLDFSHPHFVTQGETADTVTIELHKGYFLQPNELLLAQYLLEPQQGGDEDLVSDPYL